MTLHRITLHPGADLDGFRRAVRWLIAEELAPQHVVWAVDDAPGLFGDDAVHDAPPVSIPKGVAQLIEHAVCHRDPERYALLYGLVWRVLNGERDLLEVASDPLVHRIDLMARAVRRDLHKMHAFVRFRRMEGERPERFVAWFEPEHYILEAAAPFFIDRFRSLDWTILTPVGSMRWDRASLTFGPPGRREDAPDQDSFEEGWRGYYESVFNPARVNPTAMRAEMPKKYWRNMPETAAIPGLIQTASRRVESMIEQEATMPAKRTPERALEAMWDQEPKTLEELNAIIAKAGPLVPGATQAVFGEGPAHAGIVFVGEQPGDQEDLQGRPCTSSWSPGCSPTNTMSAWAGPSPNTAWVAPGTSGPAFAMIAFNSSRDLGSWSHIRSSAASGLRFAGMVASCSIMRVTRWGAVWMSDGIDSASGMFFQYFFGISARMAVGFTRAGLKMLS